LNAVPATLSLLNLLVVIPAQAGTQGQAIERLLWTPAFAGVTEFCHHAFSTGISSFAKSRIERRTEALSCPG
jgi:hypothetical protein